MLMGQISMHSHLIKRKQKVKLNDTHISWPEIIFRVSQASILGPQLFNIYNLYNYTTYSTLYNLFRFFLDLDITNHADVKTPHSTNVSLNKLLHDLEKMSSIFFKWFTDSLLKVNPEKSHLLGGMAISSSKFEKLLSIHIDNKMTFEPHVRSLF